MSAPVTTAALKLKFPAFIREVPSPSYAPGASNPLQRFITNSNNKKYKKNQIISNPIVMGFVLQYDLDASVFGLLT